MKKVTFPHMGNLCVSVKTFLFELGVEPVEPPPISKRTITLGVSNSPEFACLPLKVNMGNHLESIEKGAEIILMAGGIGPCRFGYYGEVQREILKDLKKEVEMIIIEPDIVSIYRSLNYLHGKLLSPIRLYRILTFVLEKMKAVDALEKLVHYVRPRAKKPLEVSMRLKKLIKELDEASSIDRVKRVRADGSEYLLELIDPSINDIVHVGMVGEIYQLLEPYVSLNIEERLGLLGVQVHRELFLSHWVFDHIFKLIDRSSYIKAAEPYLQVMVGGHGQETVGRAVLYAREGLDGVIQVAPFTCMPEIVAESILPLVSQNENIPIISLFFDEHSGEAGLETRLEAFVDLIRKNREREVVKDERLLRS